MLAKTEVLRRAEGLRRYEELARLNDSGVDVDDEARRLLADVFGVNRPDPFEER